MKNLDDSFGPQTREVYTKQSVDWHIVIHCLESLKTMQKIFDDKKFSDLYNQLLTYVDKKLDTHYNGASKDMYVIVKQSATEAEHARWLDSLNKNQ